jgi:beta-lactamase class A
MPLSGQLIESLLADVAGETGLQWSACVIDVDTHESLLEVNPQRVLKTASVGKLFLLIEVARQAEAGALALDELLDRRTEDPVADSGIWHTLDTDTMTIADACRLIGAVSDNLATNVLIGRIGIDAVAATTEALGYTSSALLDRIRNKRLPEHPPTLSRGNAGELADLLARLADGEVVSAQVSARVLDWIGLNTDLSMVAAAFGLDPLAHLEEDRGITLRNKTGTISTVRADVGVVSAGGRRLAYAVLANWSEDAPEQTRDEVLAAMRTLGDWLRLILARGTTPASAGR